MSLVGRDRQPSAFVVYLFLWRLTHAEGTPPAQVALTDIAEGTGALEARRAGGAELAREEAVDRRCPGSHHRGSQLRRAAAVAALIARWRALLRGFSARSTTPSSSSTRWSQSRRFHARTGPRISRGDAV